MNLTTIQPFANVTDLPVVYWELPIYAVIISVIYLSIDIVFGLISNSLLIMIIYNSPSLRTPPNMHLVNISVNNIMLCVCMIFSLTSVSGKAEKLGNIQALTGVQLFFVTVCSMQYLFTFASIGFYRNRTMKRPSLSLKVRKSMVSRSIMISWLLTHLLGLVFSLAFVRNDQVLSTSVSPFQRRFEVNETYTELPAEHISAFGLIVIAYFVGAIIIFRSYYSICQTLNFRGIAGHNRVVPMNRKHSFSSETGGETQTRQYTPVDGSLFKPYCISNGGLDGDTVVHYHKNEHMLAFEDIFALENPIMASNMQQRKQNREKKPLRATLSNTSATSNSKCPDFSDISPSGDLQRFQTLKNNSVMKIQSLRRDRINLSSATKNSMIMLAAYITCSMPLFICSVPNILQNLNESRILVILFFRLLFYLNVCVYPIWYLVFSKRVRKCMFRMFENMLVRLKLRH